MQVLVYSNKKKLEKHDLLLLIETQFVVIGKFCNYGRLRRKCIMAKRVSQLQNNYAQIIMVGIPASHQWSQEGRTAETVTV